MSFDKIPPNEENIYEGMDEINMRKIIALQRAQEPIYRGCPNGSNPCFCTGKCKEIVGYRHRYNDGRISN